MCEKMDKSELKEIVNKTWINVQIQKNLSKIKETEAEIKFLRKMLEELEDEVE